MGWSCSALAGRTLDAVSTLYYAGSNFLPDGRMYETSRREYDDGRITGTVWGPSGTTSVCQWHDGTADRQCLQGCGGFAEPQQRPNIKRAGGFLIDPNGRIVRWPGLSASDKRRAEEMGLAAYRRDHEVG